jgi:hypothetical protein
VDLVREVLNGVADERLLSNHHAGATPLQNLVKTYREKSAHNDNAPNLTDVSVGSDLKSGIGNLPVEDQVSMLYQYLVDAKRIVPAETVDQIEERKLKHTAIKAFIWVAGFVVVMLFGAVTTIAVRTGAAPSNELVSTFLEFAGEIVHLIFAGPGE